MRNGVIYMSTIKELRDEENKLLFGISMEVIADVVILSGEAFVKAISSTIKKEFGTTKIDFDATLTIGACIISLILFHKVAGVREGTIVAALIVGLIAKFFNKKLGFTAFLEKLLNLFQLGKYNFSIKTMVC